MANSRKKLLEFDDVDSSISQMVRKMFDKTNYGRVQIRYGWEPEGEIPSLRLRRSVELVHCAKRGASEREPPITEKYTRIACAGVELRRSVGTWQRFKRAKARTGER